jgi:hypothetical protein
MHYSCHQTLPLRNQPQISAGFVPRATKHTLMPYMLRDMLRAPRCTALRLTRVVLIMCLLGLGSFELYSAPAGGTELSANGVSTTGVNSQATAGGPRVLIINAHPDDESGCAVTVYKITHELGGIVDLCLITNGEGGYKYSTLAEPVYGLELTDEKIGRAHLPRIRKEEMMNAGKIIGLRNIFFLEHWDQRASPFSCKKFFAKARTISCCVYCLRPARMVLIRVRLFWHFDRCSACKNQGLPYSVLATRPKTLCR